MAFNFVANAAAALSLVSTGIEAGENGARKASASMRNAVAIKDIKDLTGDSLLNKPSEKHNAMKNAVRELDLFTGFYKAGGAIAGFTKGAVQALKGNIPAVGFSALTLAARNRAVKTIGVAGVLATTAWDFLKNGTNLFTKKNMIEK